MNYPLSPSDPSISQSTFEEEGFYKLSNAEMHEYVDNYNSKLDGVDNEIVEDGKMEIKKIAPILYEYLEPAIELTKGKTSIDKNFEKLDFNVNWKEKKIYFCYNNEDINTLIESEYLTTKIIIRNFIGRYAWLITKHRVIDCNCLNSMKNNDKEAMWNNMIILKGDKNIKDMITGKKSVSEVIEEEKNELKLKLDEITNLAPEIDKKKIEEEIKRIEENDVLLKILNLLCKNCPDIKSVYTSYIIVQRFS